MRPWMYSLVFACFLLGALSGCRTFCHTAGVCDCSEDLDNRCCHRAPWAGPPCIIDSHGKGGIGNGGGCSTCGGRRGAHRGGNCANGACGNGNGNTHVDNNQPDAPPATPSAAKTAFNAN